MLAEYFNHAKNRARPIDVSVNDRSGIGSHDFTTPEYTTYDQIVTAKWESSRGVDPYSYNAQTPDEKYMTAEEIVHSLVDIVSKNGNFQLDIKPKADGTIPDIMQRRAGCGRRESGSRPTERRSTTPRTGPGCRSWARTCGSPSGRTGRSTSTRWSGPARP